MYKYLITLLILPITIYCQEETSEVPEDSLIVINQFEYDLSKGVSMFNRSCTNQKTYDTNGKLKREINYSYKDLTRTDYIIDNVVYYHYDNNENLMVKEFYSLDGELLKLTAYEYITGTNDTLKIIQGKISDNRLIVDKLSRYKYKKGNLVKIIRYTNNKKYLTIDVINNTGSEERVYKYSKANPEKDSLRAKKTLFNGSSEEPQSIVLRYPNSSDTLRFQLEYNNDLLISKEKYINSRFINKTVYQYYPDRLTRSITVYDENEKRIEMKTYEIKKYIRDFGGIESAYLKLKK